MHPIQSISLDDVHVLDDDGRDNARLATVSPWVSNLLISIPPTLHASRATPYLKGCIAVASRQPLSMRMRPKEVVQPGASWEVAEAGRRCW